MPRKNASRSRLTSIEDSPRILRKCQIEKLVVLGIVEGVDTVNRGESAKGREFAGRKTGGWSGGSGGRYGGSQRDALGKGVEGLLEFGILLDESLDLGDGVQDSGVILAAEGPPDLGERGVGELAGEVHGDLAREGDPPGAVLGPHVRHPDAEELGRFSLNVLDGDDLLVV